MVAWTMFLGPPLHWGLIPFDSKEWVARRGVWVPFLDDQGVPIKKDPPCAVRFGSLLLSLPLTSHRSLSQADMRASMVKEFRHESQRQVGYQYQQKWDQSFEPPAAVRPARGR